MGEDLFYRMKKPILCLVAGVPASGKTMLAKELARRIADAAYLSKDLIQSPFTDTERISGDTYSMIQGPTFRILVDFAEAQLDLGKTPIIDAPFSINHGRNDAYRDWVPPFKAVAEKHRTRFAIIRCLPPNGEVLRKRIEDRLERNESKWDRWKLDHWPEFLSREPIDFPIPHDDVREFISAEPFGRRVRDVLVDFLRAEDVAAV